MCLILLYTKRGSGGVVVCYGKIINNNIVFVFFCFCFFIRAQWDCSIKTS